MLIRSQDRRSITTDMNLYIKPISNSDIGNYNFLYWIKNDTVGILGKYSSLEKSIKVLDMIQNKYFEHMTVENNGAIVNVLERPKVFQMPSDEEVEV